MSHVSFFTAVLKDAKGLNFRQTKRSRATLVCEGYDQNKTFPYDIIFLKVRNVTTLNYGMLFKNKREKNCPIVHESLPL